MYHSSKHRQQITVGDDNFFFNCIVNADQKPLKAVYSKIQYLLRNGDDTDTATKVQATPSAGINTSINSLSSVGFGTDEGFKNEFSNDLRYGKIEEPILEFIGNDLFARLRDDVFDETQGTNYGVIIKDVLADDLNAVFFKDNNGAQQSNPFVATATISFNAFLSGDDEARFWIFYNEDSDKPIPGLSTAISVVDTGVIDTTDGIIDASNDFVSGGNNHPFVSGQKVVAIAEVADPGIGIACTDNFDPTLTMYSWTRNWKMLFIM